MSGSDEPTETSHTLTVLDGLHAGAVVTLPPGVVVIGSHPDADIVLDDDGVAERHLRLEVRADGLVLLPLASGVGVAGALLPDEDPQPVAAGCPAQITLNNLTLRVTRDGAAAGPEERADPPRRLRRPALAAAAILACAAATGLGLHVRAGVSEAAQLAAAPAAPAASSPQGGVPTSGAAAPPSPEPPQAPALHASELRAPELRAAEQAPAAPATPDNHTVDNAIPVKAAQVKDAMGDAAPAGIVEAVRSKLASAGLRGILLKAEGSVLTAGGFVDPAALPAWQRAQREFDSEYAGAFQLMNRVAIKAETPLGFSVDAVWRGANPNVMVSGQKYFEGAALPDGWVLKRIEAHQLVLTRGPREAMLPY